jgi:uncharacterized membrane protein
MTSRSGPGRRTGLAAAIGVGVMLLVAVLWSKVGGLLVGFDVAAIVYLVSTWLVIARLDGEETKGTVDAEDSSAGLLGMVVVATATIALSAEVLGLARARSHDGGERSALITLSVALIVLAWLTVQTAYTLHYARLYFDGDDDGGIDFHLADGHPDYSDFAYFAFTVGMTYQVSDTEVTDRRIRRTVTRHALVSFLFGTVIIGTTINLMASLVG